MANGLGLTQMYENNYKKMELLKCTWFTLPLIIGTSACQTNVQFEEVSTRNIALIDRNSVLISSSSPAELNISFYQYSEGKSQLVHKIIQTPYLLNMGPVLVAYDSLNMTSGKRVIRGLKKIRHDYLEKGAEYLQIRNQSEATLYLAVIGRQKLRKSTSADSPNIEVVQSFPQPIYKGVPVIYLISPSEAPKAAICYHAVLEYSKRKDVVSTGKTIIKTIEFAPERLSSLIGEKVPLSPEKVMSLYRAKEDNLFLDYTKWSIQNIIPDFKNDQFEDLRTEIYWEIPSQKIWSNTGRIPLFSLDFRKQDELN